MVYAHAVSTFRRGNDGVLEPRQQQSQIAECYIVDGALPVRRPCVAWPLPASPASLCRVLASDISRVGL
jgi:hypothetical protein